MATDKLTFTFTESPKFRYDGQEIDLSKASEVLQIKRENKDGTLKGPLLGFQAKDGTFFALKNKGNNQFEIRVYGAPEKLAASHLNVRHGDITKARFGNEQWKAQSNHVFKPRNLEILPGELSDHAEFARLYGLHKAGQAGLDFAHVSEESKADLTEELAEKGLVSPEVEPKRHHSEKMSRALFEELMPKESSERRNSVGGKPDLANDKLVEDQPPQVDEGKSASDDQT